MTARDEILGRIRTALADRPSPPPVVRDYRRESGAGDLDQFAERVADYRAGVHRADGSVAATITAVLAERGVGRIVVPDGFPDEWLPEVELVREPVDSPALDDVGAVLTTCQVAIAETGTIVLDSGPGQGRRALTLVPDYHLCVVPEERIVGLVPEAVERLEPAVREGRPVTFVSGPSATSDIELSRVEGVHGPRTLDVVIAGRL
jgi:L-lactate dehydrogenase complex protein LldG